MSYAGWAGVIASCAVTREADGGGPRVLAGGVRAQVAARCLALLHLGRHSTLTGLVAKTVRQFETCGSRASDLVVWMSPSAQRETYKLDYFDHHDNPAWQPYCDIKEDGVYIDMQGYNRQRFIDCGVGVGNIHLSPINTMTSDAYFSHAAGDAHGRMAVIAMMR